jgi:hypothetical protein
MLFTLLTACSSANFLAGAVLAAREMKVGLNGYILAIIIGLCLALCNAWALYKMADAIEKHASESRRGWFGPIFFSVMMFWVIAAGFVSVWVTSAMLRLAI